MWVRVQRHYKINFGKRKSFISLVSVMSECKCGLVRRRCLSVEKEKCLWYKGNGRASMTLVCFP